MAVLAVAFGAGIGLAWWLTPQPLALWSFTALAAGIFLRARRRPAVANPALAILVATLGAFRAGTDAQIPNGSILPLLAATPQPITCQGVMVSDAEWIRPAQGPARRQGWLQITRIRNGEEWIPSSGRVLLRLHAHDVPLAYGDRVRLSGSIRGPRQTRSHFKNTVRPELVEGRTTRIDDVRASTGSARTVGGIYATGSSESPVLAQPFDENRWLRIHGASGILTIAGSEGVSRLDSSPSPWVRYRRWVASFRRQLKQLGRSLLGPLEAAYLEAFLLGEGRGIPREAWDAFKRTGVVHVLVVSGLHVGLIASILLIGLSLLRVPRALRYFLVAVGLASYCVLTGGNPPILRATVMGIVLCLGRIGGQEVPALNSLGLAALLILALNPRALADPSFQLSFSAVLGLFILTPWIYARLARLRAPFKTSCHSRPPLSRRVNSSGNLRGKLDPRWSLPSTRSRDDVLKWALNRWIARGLAASAGAWVAVAPIAAWHFHLLTPVALVANLVVIPWASILMATGFLIYAVGWVSPFAAAPFAAGFSGLLAGLNRLVMGLSDLPGACWNW